MSYFSLLLVVYLPNSNESDWTREFAEYSGELERLTAIMTELRGDFVLFSCPLLFRQLDRLMARAMPKKGQQKWRFWEGSSLNDLTVVLKIYRGSFGRPERERGETASSFQSPG